MNLEQCMELLAVDSIAFQHNFINLIEVRFQRVAFSSVRSMHVFMSVLPTVQW